MLVLVLANLLLNGLISGFQPVCQSAKYSLLEIIDFIETLVGLAWGTVMLFDILFSFLLIYWMILLCIAYYFVKHLKEKERTEEIE